MDENPSKEDVKFMKRALCESKNSLDESTKVTNHTSSQMLNFTYMKKRYTSSYSMMSSKTSNWFIMAVWSCWWSNQKPYSSTEADCVGLLLFVVTFYHVLDQSMQIVSSAYLGRVSSRNFTWDGRERGTFTYSASCKLLTIVVFR